MWRSILVVFKAFILFIVIKEIVMIGIIKSTILKVPFARSIVTFIKQTPQPAKHADKQKAIASLADFYKIEYFVESGTYMGDMIEAMKPRFKKLYSIELDQKLYEAAVKRFSSDDNVEIIQGDSGEKISEIMPKLDKPTIFWLDGHYSGGVTALGSEETPIFSELDHIMSYPVRGHVILIDDARLFGTDPSYPTVNAVKEFVQKNGNDYTIDVDNDAIRMLPKNG